MEDQRCGENILSEAYWDFLIPDYRADQNLFEGEEVCIQSGDFGCRVVSVKGEGKEPLSFYDYGYYAVPKCYTPLDMDALYGAGISAVQTLPALQATGEGVMIGFVDTGIDLAHPVFRRLDGRTRIAGIWDQTDREGSPPAGFFYGSSYTQEEIDRLLEAAQKNPQEAGRLPGADVAGHGTYVASLAAGSPVPEERFAGAAPEASVAMVKLKPAKGYLKDFYGIPPQVVCYQENDILLGLAYLHHLAEERGMPLVICLALGTNFGGHSGSSLLARALDQYAYTEDRAVVIGAGNEAAGRHHFYHRFQKTQETVVAEIRVGEGIQGFSAEVWVRLPDVVTVSLVSPSGERTGPVSLRQGQRYEWLFSFDATRVTVEDRLLLENNDSQMIFLRFLDPAPGVWKLEILSLQRAQGEVHVWLPVQEFVEGEVFFLEADPNLTITEPGSAPAAMTVAYYNGADNGVDIHSGRGYTRNGTIKPDYAAPGVKLKGAAAGGGFVTRTGSSGGAAIAAGASALLMEWLGEQPEARFRNSVLIRNTIVLGAAKRENMEYPNREWGYGTLNVYQSLDRMRQL